MLLALAMMPIISYAGTNVVEANGGEVTDGQSFVDALGGQATYTESDDIFTITLNGDISLAKDYIDIESGKYILNGSGTITRGEGYTGTLIKVGSGASLNNGIYAVRVTASYNGGKTHSRQKKFVLWRNN